MNNQDPSISLDPANGSSGAPGAFRQILRKFLQGTDGMLPGVVIAVQGRDFVTVQPQIMIVGTNGQQVARAQIQKVPIFIMGAGKFCISFPVTPGDFGWVIASDRDISLFVQTMTNSPPNTDRLHNFSDAVFIPDAMRQWSLASEDAANTVWQSYDGTIKIALGTTQIKIVHPTKVLIDCPQVVCTGTITGQIDVLSGPNNISGKGHTHPVIGSETGAPNA